VKWDTTRLPEVYTAARALPAEAVATWREAIGRLVPPSPAVRRVVDLGCGTGRFSSLLAELYGVAVVGVDPSQRMLAKRESRDLSSCHFLAGDAEAIPLATGTCDLVFLSMVYHHLASVPGALGEMRRVLAPDGHVLVRNPTRDSHEEGYEYLRFFPEAVELSRRTVPSREAVTQAFVAAGFARVSHEVVWHRFADNHADLLRKISLRGLSTLEAISDEAFARGLRDLERHCREAEGDEPIYEPVDLFAFRR
jgi:SAM-dependent methyltransferase